MNLIEKIFNFIVGLAVILGGLVCVAWFVGSLLVYCLLNRPMWEEAILLGVTIFVFLWFCVSLVRRRPSRDSARKLQDDDNWGEDRAELEDYLDEIEEELRKARREGKEKETQDLEEARKDILSQIEGHHLEGTVEKLRRLREEARKAGRKVEAEEHSKQIEKHDAKLKERGERIEDLPQHLRLFVYFMLGSLLISLAFLILMIPMGMLAVTWGLWEEWAGGSEWMRSPGVMIAVIFSCLTLACLAVRYVSGFFSPDKSETKKKKRAEN
jgi:type VI protein secretion system component VasK